MDIQMFIWILFSLIVFAIILMFIFGGSDFMNRIIPDLGWLGT